MIVHQSEAPTQSLLGLTHLHRAIKAYSVRGCLVSLLSDILTQAVDSSGVRTTHIKGDVLKLSGKGTLVEAFNDAKAVPSLVRRLSTRKNYLLMGRVTTASITSP